MLDGNKWLDPSTHTLLSHWQDLYYKQCDLN